MRITQVSTWDVSGGAARAAYRLQTGLRSLGQDSKLLSLYKGSSDENVLRFEVANDIGTRLRRGLKRRYLHRSHKLMHSRQEGSTLFSDDRSQHSADVLRQIPKCDIVNLHWVSSFIDYRAFFQRWPHGRPLVWTLHDMNPFTGGCHYDEGCGKYSQRCGACPQLGSSDPFDFSREVWSRKHEALSSGGARGMHVVTPSRWLADEATKSALFCGFRLSVIPNGVDTNDFQPRDRSVARERLGLPKDAKVVLFVADSVTERRKGLSILAEALNRLDDCFFLSIGRQGTCWNFGARSKAVDFVDDDVALSFIYSASDVFALPSLQDNFPNTALESLACGLPVVAFDVGGVPEIVRDDCTGLVVPAANPEALASAIDNLLKDEGRRRAMSLNCRRIAVEEYSLQVQARRYVELYSSLRAIRGM